MRHAHLMPDNGLPTDPYADSSQHSLDMVAIAAEGRLIQVSPAWTRALGWSMTELTTTSVLDFVHPEDLDATEVALAQVRQEQTYTAFANRFLHKDGSYRTLRWSLEPNKNVVFVGARDISTYTGLRERAERSEMGVGEDRQRILEGQQTARKIRVSIPPQFQHQWFVTITEPDSTAHHAFHPVVNLAP